MRPFPDKGGKWLISTSGGVLAVWSRNGRELFYRKDKKMMAVDVSTTGEFTSGAPKQLFEGPYVLWPGTYDVARDGRFLMLKAEPRPVNQLILVQNWFTELQQRVPTR